MGSCGCEEEYLVKLPAPEEGHWYILGIYPGCNYCGEDWYLVVQHLDEKGEFSDYILDCVDTVSFSGAYYPTWVKQILDINHLQNRLGKYLDEEGRWGLDDFISQGELRSVFYDTFLGRNLK